MKRKVMFIVLLLAVVLIYLNQSKFEIKETYISPNNKYILELYKETEYRPFLSLSSEQGFAEAYVVLKNNKGEVLLEPRWYASCDFLIGDLQIEWQDKINKVYFTKFNYIDLEKYVFECY